MKEPKVTKASALEEALIPILALAIIGGTLAGAYWLNHGSTVHIAFLALAIAVVALVRTFPRA